MLSWVEHEKSFITSGPDPPILHYMHHLNMASGFSWYVLQYLIIL